MLLMRTGADAAGERMRALAESMRLFAATTSDYPKLLQTICDRVTYHLGGVCTLALLSDDGVWILPAVVAAHDAHVAALVSEAFSAAPIRFDETGVAMSTIRTGKPAVVAHATPERMAQAVASRFAPLVLRVGVRGLLSVPLHIQGKNTGALTLYRYEDDSPPFDADDVTLAQSLSDHASLALSNARLVDSLRRELAERRRAEEEAKTFIALVQNSNDFIAMADFGGRVLFVNRAGRRLVGLGPDVDVRSLTMADFHTNEGLPRAELLRQRGSWQGEGVLRHFETGEPIPTRMSSFIARDMQGEPLCFATIQHDLRATKQLESQLQHARRLEAVGLLAGGVAHDFNNLLTVILSCTSMLAESLPQGAGGRAEVEAIDTAAQRAALLTRQLLAFGRRQVLQPNILSLNDVVARMQPIVRHVLAEDIELRVQLDPALSTITGDASQIEQVVLNLIMNARDAMPHGGRITIATTNIEVPADDARVASGDLRTGRHAALSVTDTGIGMDDATKARVFEPFFTTKEAARGSGLGLASAFGIVKQSGGDIAVESAPGRGSTFRICFPRAGDDAVTPAARPAACSEVVVHGAETILLVEDDASVRAVLGETLRRAGYRVLEASGPETALSLNEQRTRDVDLIVSDVIMPVMSGPELVKRLATRLTRARVLYVSGYTDEALGQRGVLEPGVELLRKPFVPSELLRRVRNVIDATM
jgi:PAS domain S-box-containing protein